MSKENNFDNNFIKEKRFLIVVTGMTFKLGKPSKLANTCIIMQILLSRRMVYCC